MRFEEHCSVLTTVSNQMLSWRLFIVSFKRKIGYYELFFAEDFLGASADISTKRRRLVFSSDEEEEEEVKEKPKASPSPKKPAKRATKAGFSFTSQPQSTCSWFTFIFRFFQKETKSPAKKTQKSPKTKQRSV